MNKAPAVALTIAGSDCSAGAGLQADLKTFSASGVHGLTAVTSIVAETPLVVESVHPVEPAALQEQVRLLLDSYPVAAIKTGMLGSKPHVVAVAELLADYDAPLVVDPVMVASTGASLLEPDAVAAYRDRLLPLATVATPNRPEAEQLLGEGEALDPDTLAERLAERFGCSVLVTGGHEQRGPTAIDYLAHEGASQRFESPWIEISSSHGTGCTLSAALAAHLALGRTVPEAVSAAKQFLDRALAESYAWPVTDAGELRAINQLPAHPFRAGES